MAARPGRPAATEGGGGHTQALLDAAGPDAQLIGLDWDAAGAEFRIDVTGLAGGEAWSTMAVQPSLAVVVAPTVAPALRAVG